MKPFLGFVFGTCAALALVSIFNPPDVVCFLVGFLGGFSGTATGLYLEAR